MDDQKAIYELKNWLFFARDVKHFVYDKRIEEEINPNMKLLNDVLEVIIVEDLNCESRVERLQALYAKYITADTDRQVFAVLDELQRMFLHYTRLTGNLFLDFGIYTQFANNKYEEKLNRKCDIRVLNNESPEYQILLSFINPPNYSFNIFAVNKIFEVSYRDEDFINSYGDDNRRLLFHGTPVWNCYSILRHGLRPNVSKKKGPNFGKCVYFCDLATKAYRFCKPIKGDEQDGNKGQIKDGNGWGLLLVCDVALGRTLELKDPNGAPIINGTHSYFMAGRRGRDEETDFINGAEVSIDSAGLEWGRSESLVRNNEYAVFDSSRVRPKYMIMCQLNERLNI